MKKMILRMGLTCSVSCSAVLAEQAPYLDPALSVEQRVNDLLPRMTLREKIGQMVQYTADPNKENKDSSGQDDLTVKLENAEEREYAEGIKTKADLVKKGEIGSFLKVPGMAAANYIQKVAEQSRLKIPVLVATDAIHGHGSYTSPSTIFPTPLSLASTFDSSLAEAVARMTRKEMRATGYHWTFSPNVDVVRDSRWGRTGETFGEDPYLASEMGTAMVRGYQNGAIGKDSVLSCLKHFAVGGEALNGINGGPADVSEFTLRSIYFPPFEAGVKAGAFTLMPAHNSLNGTPCHSHKWLLTDILRGEWGFKGFVVSDWMDVRAIHVDHKAASSYKEASGLAVNAGMDVNMHGPQFLDFVDALVKEGVISEERINASVRPILEAKFRLGLFENRYVDPVAAADVVLCQEHKDMALNIARKSIVLLKNRNSLLPLSPDMKSVLVTGPSADRELLLGDWVREQPPENITTVLEGIRQTVSESTTVDYLDCGDVFWSKEVPFTIDQSVIREAAKRAASNDCAIVVVGENAQRHMWKKKTAGENCDYSSLQLPGNQLQLIQEIQKTGTPVVVVLINARALAIKWCKENVPAIVEAWEPGMLGGQAVAEVLFGKVNPSGRLPISFPQSVGHLQCAYNLTPARGHGRYGDSSADPLFPFGHGLSYTTFAYTNLKHPEQVRVGEPVEVTVDVTNTGGREGDEVVLLYLNDQISSVVTPPKELKAFQRISLKAGETRTVKLTLPPAAFS
ncbi:MAG TPA: glycoside hydrolase family 3 N-terminal domain-containing protein, partial [Pontiella sp.]